MNKNFVDVSAQFMPQTSKSSWTFLTQTQRIFENGDEIVYRCTKWSKFVICDLGSKQLELWGILQIVKKNSQW
jgi:hypothetical protein